MRDQLERKETEYVRGKVAGHDVRDNEDNVIVARGQTITDEAIDKACHAGKLHYLMLAAAAFIVEAGGEKAKERLKEFRDVTEGHEAEFVWGEVAMRDVVDFQGNVMVRQGETITETLIETAREKGLLQ